MDGLTDQQKVELGFWQSLVAQHGANYRAFRLNEYHDKTKHFEPWWGEQKGVGCDVGCGCVSVLGDLLFNSNKIAWAIDPLYYHYMDLCPDVGAAYSNASAESMPFSNSSFDWLFCVNMLDHTPDPRKAVSEMYRVLKPGGKLFLEVHFDDALSPAHYGLWNEQTIQEIVNPVFTNCLQSKIIRVDEHNQSQYWAVYQK